MPKLLYRTTIPKPDARPCREHHGEDVDLAVVACTHYAGASADVSHFLEDDGLPPYYVFGPAFNRDLDDAHPFDSLDEAVAFMHQRMADYAQAAVS